MLILTKKKKIIKRHGDILQITNDPSNKRIPSDIKGFDKEAVS